MRSAGQQKKISRIKRRAIPEVLEAYQQGLIIARMPRSAYDLTPQISDNVSGLFLEQLQLNSRLDTLVARLSSAASRHLFSDAATTYLLLGKSFGHQMIV